MSVIKGICYVFAACKEYLSDTVFIPTENDLVIAADGGFDILKDKSVVPDIVLGDFDSIEKIPTHNNLIKHPSEKDDTDTLLSCKLGLEKGYKNFVIYGGLGGRIDHTLANIRTLCEIAERDGRGFLIGNGSVITVINNSKLVFPKEKKGYLSIFSCDSVAEKITLKGFKYNADNLTLPYSSSLCVSNEFTGKESEVSVNNGKILIVWYEDEAAFINDISNFTIG